MDQAHGQTCTLVTRGRRTGAEHVVRVWFVTLGTRAYAPSRRGLQGDWLQNALAAGGLEVRVGRDSWQGTAALATPGEIPAVLEAFAEKYQSQGSIIATWRQQPPTFVRVDIDRSGAS